MRSSTVVGGRCYPRGIRRIGGAHSGSGNWELGPSWCLVTDRELDARDEIPHPHRDLGAASTSVLTRGSSPIGALVEIVCGPRPSWSASGSRWIGTRAQSAVGSGRDCPTLVHPLMLLYLLALAVGRVLVGRVTQRGAMDGRRRSLWQIAWPCWPCHRVQGVHPDRLVQG